MKKKILFSILIISITMGISFCFANETIKVGYYENKPLVFQDANGNPSGFFMI
ncbi:hypothetical protein QUF55_06030 [Clostridiaceae bacterium HSG29]|nr:hypothetical protein [Clostridiaceae bacterium HSG29]